MKSGSYSQGSNEVEVEGYQPGERPVASLLNYEGQTGIQATKEVGMKGGNKYNYASDEYDTRAYAQSYLGASTSTTLNSDGLTSENAAGLGVTTGVSAQYKLTSSPFEIAGKQMTTSVTAKGAADATMAAGLQGNLYANKDKQGIEIKGDAALMVSADLKITGEAGPIKGTAGVGVTAGLGAGFEFAFFLEGGKLRIGCGAYAALGFGVKGNFSVEIDLVQAAEVATALIQKGKELGIKGAQMAFRVLDGDGDGKITPNDAATHMSRAMKGVAKATDKAADGLITTLDGDGDGKFDLVKDGSARAQQITNYVGQKGADVAQWTTDQAKKAVGTGKSLLDADKDGQLTAKDIAQRSVQVKQWADDKLEQTGEVLGQGVDAVVTYGSQQLDQAVQGAKVLHKAADQNGDGQLGLDDAVIAGGKLLDAGKSGVKAAGETVGTVANYAKDKTVEAAKWTVDKTKQAAKVAHKAADRDGDGQLTLNDAKTGLVQAKQSIDKSIQQSAQMLHQGYQTAKVKAAQTVKAVYNASDLNKDGKVDAKDAVLAKQKLVTAAQKANAAALKTAADLYKKYDAANKLLAQKAQQAKAAVANAADLNKDGKVDAKDLAIAYQRAQKAKAAAYARAGKAVQATNAQLTKAAQTLYAGYQQASAQLGQTYDKLANFFGG
ncbi:MAG: hypothetical protein IT385_26550 [Deltaproteobacteria bacterium]|nr:hypothetical protein [Deltaproteobacteria bacterium]